MALGSSSTSTAIIALLLVLPVCIIPPTAAATVHVQSAVPAAAVDISADRCAVFKHYKQCQRDSRCAWCGNTTLQPPSSFCHSISNSPTTVCCMPPVCPLTDPMYCPQASSLCTGGDRCHIRQWDYPGIGNCTLATCCPLNKPVVCGGRHMCYEEGYHCCVGAAEPMACNATQTCCGGGLGTMCINPDQQCCSTPDGTPFSCPQDKVCNINGRCDNPSPPCPGKFPVTCGGGATATCCQEGGVCCQSPGDGFSNFCCKSGEQCGQYSCSNLEKRH